MGCTDSKEEKKDTKEAASTPEPEAPVNPLLRRSVKEGGFQSAQFVVKASGAIADAYDLDKKKLGEGSYGTVCKGRNKTTQDMRAIKSVSKGQVKNIVRFRQEIAIMKNMDHPNIVKLYEYYEDRKHIYLVMELAAGGELFDRIVETGHFTEAQAAATMQQIFRAIFYMHQSHICHRDLKPENFLFMTKGPIESALLKIIDFGLSTPFKEGDLLKTKAGTPYYVAPQVLQGKYNQASDLWSAGVIMYVLLCGYPPFHGDNDADVLQKVKKGIFFFHPRDWTEISQDAKNLVSGLLKMNPTQRFTAEDALHNVWVMNRAPQASNKLIHPTLIENLKTFKAKSQIKKAALHIIAGQMNEGEIKGLRETFTALDENGDGFLTLTELRDSFEKAGIKEIPGELQAVIDGMDCDGNGIIEYTEFLAAAIDHRAYIEEHVCWSAFVLFDKDHDGQITKKELAQVMLDDNLKSLAGNAGLDKIMDDCDKDHDGQISFEEFWAMMRETGEMSQALGKFRDVAAKQSVNHK